MAAAEGGEGGEGGQGGQGGEGGVDPEQAANDPVAWGVALGVIEAHYRAGLKAYAAGNSDAGTVMFAHGFSEVYAELEPIFAKRGAADLGPAMQATIEDATNKAPAGEVGSRVEKVLGGLDAAAPREAAVGAAGAKIVTELLDRAALQYFRATKEEGLEPYLDGLGFALAAGHHAPTALAWLDAHSKTAAADALRDCLGMAERAFTGAERPKTPSVEAGPFLAAASKLKIEISRLR